MLTRILLVLSVGCVIASGWLLSSAAQAPGEDPTTGTLRFTANGEDFIRQGFTSKDGWNISFNKVLVNLSNIAAMQTSPPFDPDLNYSYSVSALAELNGSYVVDLAAGDETAEPILVDEVEALAGQYLRALAVAEPVRLEAAEMEAVLEAFRTYGQPLP